MGFLSRIVSGVRAQASIASAAPPIAASRQAPAGGEGPGVELGFDVALEPAPSALGVAPAASASHARVAQAEPRSAVPREDAGPPSAAVSRRDRDAVHDRPSHAALDRAAALALPLASASAPDGHARSADVAPPSLASLRTALRLGAVRGSADEIGSAPVAGEAIQRPATGAPAGTGVEVPDAVRSTGAERGGDREARDRLVRDAVPDTDAATSRARSQPSVARAPHGEAPGIPESVVQAALLRAQAAPSEAIAPSPPAEAAPSRRDVEPRRPERPNPAHAAAERVTAPRVHIGRLEVIVVAPSPSRAPSGAPQRGPADVASRRYLRKA